MSGSDLQYVFPEMKLSDLFPKHNYNVLSLNFHNCVSVSELYISRIILPILLSETENLRTICSLQYSGAESLAAEPKRVDY